MRRAGILSLRCPRVNKTQQPAKSSTRLKADREPPTAYRPLLRFHGSVRKAKQSEDEAKIAETLTKLAAETNVASKNVKSTLEYTDDVLSTPIGDESLQKLRLYTHQAYALNRIGRPDQSLSILNQAETACANASLQYFADFLDARGCALATLGIERDSMACFDLSLEIAAKKDSATNLCFKFYNAANNSVQFGDFNRAYSLHERAVQLAEAEELGWPLPWTKLTYAWTCLHAGDIARARGLLESALLAVDDSPVIRFWKTAVGTMVAALTGDKALYERTSDPSLLAMAFSSQEPQRIGPVVGACCESYFLSERTAASARLLRRALRSISSLEECWWMLSLVARLGQIDEINRAIALVNHLHSGMALRTGFQDFLEGALKIRLGHSQSGAESATRAARVFVSLGWRYHAAVALELAQRHGEARQAYLSLGATAHYQRLKGRNQRESSIRATPFSLSVRHVEIAGLLRKAEATATSQCGSALRNAASAITLRVFLTSLASTRGPNLLPMCTQLLEKLECRTTCRSRNQFTFGLGEVVVTVSPSRHH
jgi:tetratricopeptide (TPR) repeat protein